jgi:caffeoyl-CoA O-methyltransferase
MTTTSRPVTPLAILAAKLEGVREQLAAVEGLDPAVGAELAAARALAGWLDPYLSRCTTPESPALAALAHRTGQRDWSARHGDGVAVALEPEMLCGHVEGQLLRLLVHVTRARQVLELGLFTGYSALAMAEALPADGRLIACELDADSAAFARDALNRAPGGRRVEIRVGDAARTLDQLADAGHRFDLVFIDADKPGYLGYVHTLLDAGLVNSGGLIVVDNTLLQGEPYAGIQPSANGAAIAAFNHAIAADPRVEQVLLPVRDGLTLIRPLP